MLNANSYFPGGAGCGFAKAEVMVELMFLFVKGDASRKLGGLKGMCRKAVLDVQ